MKNLLTLFFACIIAALLAFTASAQSSFTSQANDFFATNVKSGMVDYSGIKKSPKMLNELVAAIGKQSAMKSDAQKAFLINAYNILVIKNVVDLMPLKGPLAVDDFFTAQKFMVQGKKTSLNDLEKKMLGANFPDPRLHFALVCAAMGCPQLASFAFKADGLDSQLEKQTTTALNSAGFIKVDPKTKQLQLSQIFDWYQADFGGKDKLMSYVSRYFKEPYDRAKGVAFYEYDWNLNIQK